MQKTKLDKFIQKYALGGNVTSVAWDSNGDKLQTAFVTSDRSVHGTVSIDNFNFQAIRLGIYNTDQLQKLLAILGDDVTLNLTQAGDRAVSLNVKNGSVSFDYVLSDLSVIPSVTPMKRVPIFDTKIKLDTNCMESFIKGTNALEEGNTFTIKRDKFGVVNMIIGYAQMNTNRVNIPVEVEVEDLTDSITFNTNIFKEILVANKECTSAMLEVSNEGLAKVNFKIDEYDSTYYIVAQQGDN